MSLEIIPSSHLVILTGRCEGQFMMTNPVINRHTNRMSVSIITSSAKYIVALKYCNEVFIVTWRRYPFTDNSAWS